MIIAELCQNHNGDSGLLYEMVMRSAEAGARFCKIQSFFAEDLSDEWKTKDYDRLKNLELNWDQHASFVEWCKQAGVTPMTSVYTFRYAEKLYHAGFRHIKIGSAQASNEDLIRRYLVLSFKVFVSTGGQDLSSLPHVGPLEGVFHCVSKYPHSPWEADLTRMLETRKYWLHTAMGFSDHSDPLSSGWADASKAALFLGASYVERHFTMLPRDQTKDGPVSVDLAQLKELCAWDQLSQEERLEKEAWLGLLRCPKTTEERELIYRYQSRWKP